MLPPHLAVLQSRLLASVVALCLLLSLAHATDLPLVPGAQEGDLSALQAVPAGGPAQDASSSDGSYAPDFDYFDRSILGRQEPTTNELKNNELKTMDISPGTTTYFVLRMGKSRMARSDDSTPEALDARDVEAASDHGGANANNTELRRRQAGRNIWISANTCRQPMPNTNITQSAKNNPQLVMYVSTQNQKPGPQSPQNLLTDPTGVLFESGFANFTTSVNSDVYIGVSAPNLDKDWFGSWQFEVAASTDGSFHSYNDTNTFLFMVDTDSESALFITYPLSESNTTEEVDKWKNQNPFRMYAFPAGLSSPIAGVEHSYCAIKTLFDTTNNLTVETGITTKFGGNYPKAQFHMQGLDNGKVYNGFLVVEGNQTETMALPGVGQVRGGGKVFQQFNWTTKTEDSCQVLFDLDFCDNVAYAVPSSPQFKFNDTALKKIYDDQARAYYTNFSRSLAQVACDTVPESQYSLAVTCRDCERAYKNWLCSVLIPRCEDYASTDDWLQERNVNAAFANGTTPNVDAIKRERFGFNQSRNPLIDEVIKPGPYKEMKPCEDLCVDIVRTCPASLGFACPNEPARSFGYGQRDPTQNQLWCNFPGAVVKLNVQGAGAIVEGRAMLVVAVAMAVIMFMWI